MHSSNDVTERGTEENRQQNTCDRKDEVKGVSPNAIAKMAPKFDSDTAEHQKPQHHNQRQIKAAEAGRIEQRERKVERSSRGQQPDFITVPHRANRTQNSAAFGIVLRNE